MSGSNLTLTPLSDTAETKAAQNFQMAGEINFQMCSKTRARTKPFRQGIQCVGAGWGGRDRTSEWRNQNPLPYRLATPQLARNARGAKPPQRSLGHRRSIGGDQPFQQARRNFARR